MSGGRLVKRSVSDQIQVTSLNGMPEWAWDKSFGYLVNPSHNGGKQLRICLEVSSDGEWDREESSLAELAVRSPATGSTGIRGNKDDYIRYILAHRFNNNELANIQTPKPSSIDILFFDIKLKECISNHKECKSIAPGVQQLRVINVNTGHLGPAPEGCEYTALSYVWGQPAGQIEIGSLASPPEFPLLIKDAIAVTKALGLQYLWVDRYCIDQDPQSSQKSTMIEQMDRIYANAYVTIIAASGSSAENGLPGFSGQQLRQAPVVIGKTQLIELSSNGEDAIMASKWATRGWTYQEGYLSKRRLIFMENEVLFVCNREVAREPVIVREGDRDREINENNARSQKGYSMHSFHQLMPLSDIYLKPIECFETHIHEFSKRSLSDPSDGLKAFLSILNNHELITTVTHLWGIPMVSLLGREGNNYPAGLGQAGTTLSSLRVLSYKSNRPPVDSHGQDKELILGDHTVKRVPSMYLRHEEDSKGIDLRNFAHQLRPHPPHYLHPKELCITSFTIPLRFREINDYRTIHRKRKPTIVSTFAVKPNVFLTVPILFDRAHSPSDERGLIIPHSGSFFSPIEVSAWESYAIIVLHPLARKRYERAGITFVDYGKETGALSSDESILGRDIFVNENSNIIPGAPTGTMGNYFFLKDAKWETICLV
ncbi:heterokaryon incompatibility protein-domain-containing protein [Nemania sp. FL0031]|nr:heterokaryon incompatibility protein-domain-containing protein [Nemania sp. FL0031]